MQLYNRFRKLLGKQLGRNKIQHLLTCEVGQNPGWEICKVTDKPHNWSGWPGAYCLQCFANDLMESCLGDCECHCHAEFWKSYQQAEEKAMLLDLIDRCYSVLSRPQRPPEELMVDLHKCLDHFGRIQ